jgi:hypothetical protein
MAPPPTPAGPSGPATGSPIKFTEPSLLAQFKTVVVRNKHFTKAGLIDAVYMHFRGQGLSRAAVRKMVDSGASRTRGLQGEWKIHEGL